MYMCGMHVHAHCCHIVCVLMYVDVNECDEGLVTCQANSHCVNTDGDYQCICDLGYFKNGSSCGKLNN